MAATWKSIKALRETLGISQGDLARGLRVSPAWLSLREQRGLALSVVDAKRALGAIDAIRERRDRSADRQRQRLNERIDGPGHGEAADPGLVACGEGAGGE
jgi:transcriptional regulator with XRE-family HTH domain